MISLPTKICFKICFVVCVLYFCVLKPSVVDAKWICHSQLCKKCYVWSCSCLIALCDILWDKFLIERQKLICRNLTKAMYGGFWYGDIQCQEIGSNSSKAFWWLRLYSFFFLVSEYTVCYTAQVHTAQKVMEWKYCYTPISNIRSYQT